MKHIAIDIETTGLEPDVDEILQIGAIVETDFKTPVEDLPRFEALIEPSAWGMSQLNGNPLVAEMHAELMSRIERSSEVFRGTDAEYGAITSLCRWVGQHTANEKAVVSGKNFAAFDMRFLRAKAPDIPWHRVFQHRHLDPGSMFYGGEDVPPSLKEIAEREGIEYDAHDALGDCEAVVRAIRLFVGKVGR